MQHSPNAGAQFTRIVRQSFGAGKSQKPVYGLRCPKLERANGRRGLETFSHHAYAYTRRWMFSGSKRETSWIILPRRRWRSPLRRGAPRTKREAPTLAAVSTIVSAAESLTA